MKNFLILLSLIMFSSVASVYAFDKPKERTGIAVMKTTGSTFKLFYKGEKPGRVKVTIYDAAGKALFTESFYRMDNFVRPYNFSALEEGNYTIEVSDENGKQVEKINYVNKKKAERLVHLMKLAGTSDKYVLSVANKGKDVITIKVLDNEDHVLYQETTNIDGDFAKVYKIDTTDKDVVFEVTDKQGLQKTIHN